jgi:hypothetical protein
VIASERVLIPDHDSVVGFTRAPELGWNRYLTIEGRPAYIIGGACDTCAFLFERQSGANQKVSSTLVRQQLRQGLRTADSTVVEAVSTLLPGGTCVALLQRVLPRLVYPRLDGDYFAHEQVELWGVDPFFGLPNDPHVPYYRTRSADGVEPSAAFFEFVIPMVPPTWLDRQTAQGYIGELMAGAEPTALAIAVLDVRGPAILDPDVLESKPASILSHWCLAHYVLDGHHKMWAASEAQRPVTLLSFLSTEHGISTDEQIERCLELLADDPNTVNHGTGRPI